MAVSPDAGETPARAIVRCSFCRLLSSRRRLATRNLSVGCSANPFLLALRIRLVFMVLMIAMSTITVTTMQEHVHQRT